MKKIVKNELKEGESEIPPSKIISYVIIARFT